MKKLLVSLCFVASFFVISTSVQAQTIGFEDTSILDFGSSGLATQDNSIFYQGTSSVKLDLPDTEGYGRVAVNGSFGTLNDFISATFFANITGSSPNTLAPYVMLGLDSSGDGAYNYSDDSLVIAFITGGASYAQDTWFKTGLYKSTSVHVVEDRGELAAGTYSASGTQDTLENLALAAYNSAPSTLFGDLEILQIRIGAGLWPSSGAVVPYTAYVDELSVTSAAPGAPVPEPATMALFSLGLLGVAGVSRRRK